MGSLSPHHGDQVSAGAFEALGDDPLFEAEVGLRAERVQVADGEAVGAGDDGQG